MSEAVWAAVILHVVSWGYAVAVEYTRERWPASRRYTFVWVVGGVAMTGIAASFALGLHDALVVAGYFVASGIPMSVGAMIKHIVKDSR